MVSLMVRTLLAQLANMNVLTSDGRQLHCEGRPCAWSLGLCVELQFTEEGSPLGRLRLLCLSSDPYFASLRDLDDDVLVQKAMDRIDEWTNRIDEAVLQCWKTGAIIFIPWRV